MTGEVIKSFLVSLGFEIDQSSLARFNKSLTLATVKTAALAATITATAGAVVKGIAGISEGFEQMGYEFRLIAPSINKAIVLRREMLKAYSLAGINIRRVVADSVRLNFSLAKTKFAFDAIYKSVGSKFFGLITKQSDLLRDKIYKNMPKIQAALERFVKFIFKAFEAVTILTGRLWSVLTRIYDFFVMLDKATDGWSTKILGVIAAWKLLNLAFLASPLGLIIAGLILLLGLFDDFKTFQEHGRSNSFFDWSAVVPIINNLASAFDHLHAIISDIVDLFSFGFGGDFEKQIAVLSDLVSHLTGLFNNLYSAVIATSDAIDGIVRHFSGASGIFSKLLDSRDRAEGWLANGASAALNAVSNAAPLGANNTDNSSTQNVHVVTNMNISGSADAQATGRAAGSGVAQAGRSAADLLRNNKKRVQ